MKIEDIENLKNGALVASSENLSSLPKMPRHTQASMRIVKFVTYVVCGYEIRDGVIRNKFESHSRMKTFNIKCEYKVQTENV